MKKINIFLYFLIVISVLSSLKEDYDNYDFQIVFYSPSTITTIRQKYDGDFIYDNKINNPDLPQKRYDATSYPNTGATSTSSTTTTVPPETTDYIS